MPAQKTNQRVKESTLKKGEELEERAQMVRPEPLKILLQWRALTRPFKKRDREYFTTVGAIVFLLIVILLFLKEWFLILAIIAMAFVAYILATVQPAETEHKITNRGIITGGRTYFWEELNQFWFSERWGQKILHVETLVRFPRRLLLLLGEISQDQFEKTLSQYLPLEEPEKTWMDNASEWLSRRVPLERSS